MKYIMILLTLFIYTACGQQGKKTDNTGKSTLGFSCGSDEVCDVNITNRKDPVDLTFGIEANYSGRLEVQLCKTSGANCSVIDNYLCTSGECDSTGGSLSQSGDNSQVTVSYWQAYIDDDETIRVFKK
jgi:hypothetical protein